MNEYQLGIIGGGNMAGAILGSAVGSGFIPAGDIVVCEPQAGRREFLNKKFSVACEEDNNISAGCGRVLLAVKPQVMGEVLAAAAGAVRPETLVISIAAGYSTAKIDQALGGRGRVVRVMPNTPVLVAQGASAVCGGPRATADDVNWTTRLFTCGGGVAVEVSEAMMDAVTIVSGCGPAYFFYLIEAMIAAGVEEGLPHDVATQLAVQTCAGSARLLAETRQSPSELRRQVTSPGGVTLEAIKTLDQAGVREKMVQAFRNAANRSRELGK